jgi:cobalt-zinc-cadmium efflux system protein
MHRRDTNPAGGHSAAHGGLADAQRRRLSLVFLLTTGFMGVEALGGWVSGSLALLADAGHMLSDSLAIALSYGAAWLAGKEASARHTFGFRRAEILAAFLNAMGLVAVAVWIVVEALERISTPRPVSSGILLAVALGGLAVNVTGLALLRGQGQRSMNIRAAVWHIMGDLLGSLGAIAAALVIRFTGWTPVDALIGMGIAFLIGAGALRILFDSTNMLLDSVPKELNSNEVSAYLASYPDVSRICDLHIWGVSSTEAVLTAHLIVSKEVDRDPFLAHLLRELKSRFGLAHMTIQLENNPQESCPPDW